MNSGDMISSIYIPINDAIWMSFIYFGLSSKFSKKNFIQRKLHILW